MYLSCDVLICNSIKEQVLYYYCVHWFVYHIIFWQGKLLKRRANQLGKFNHLKEFCIISEIIHLILGNKRDLFKSIPQLFSDFTSSGYLAEL